MNPEKELIKLRLSNKNLRAELNWQNSFAKRVVNVASMSIIVLILYFFIWNNLDSSKTVQLVGGIIFTVISVFVLSYTLEFIIKRFLPKNSNE